MTVVSEDEVADQYAAIFGKKDGQIVKNLSFKVSNLALRWQMFLYFFCGPTERVDVLNEASGRTAKVLTSLLWDDALLRVRQMTDPAKTKWNDNLSLEHLVRVAHKINGIDLEGDRLRTLEACRPAKEYATKNLAHLDLEHALGDQTTNVTRGQTTEAIRAICKFVQEFHLQVRDTTYVILPIGNSEDESQFLLRLYQGNRAEKDLKAASRAAAEAGDIGAIKRPDIPDWIWERRNPMDLF